MSEPYLAQIVMFGGNFAPRSWAFCDGQLLAINSNQALFSLLGTTYGGDGRTTFALPDCRGRLSTHSGGNATGPGLSQRRLGAKGGVQSVTLNHATLPSHGHPISNHKAASAIANAKSPSGAYPAQSDDNENNFSSDSSDSALASGAIAVGNAGASQPHDNMPPFLAINFIIALQGIFPSRN